MNFVKVARIKQGQFQQKTNKKGKTKNRLPFPIGQTRFSNTVENVQKQSRELPLRRSLLNQLAVNSKITFFI